MLCAINSNFIKDKPAETVGLNLIIIEGEQYGNK